MKLTMCAALAAGMMMTADAGVLKNSSFEQSLEVKDGPPQWGDLGELFGECRRVNVGDASNPKIARHGTHMVCIDTPASSWNGIWQQISWKENAAYRFKGSYLIQGGDLPGGVATFLKVEFYDTSSTLLSAVEGKPHVNDTGGKWLDDELEGVTPVGTRWVRFVLIAGENSAGESVNNRIYWDMADAEGGAAAAK